MNTIMSGERIGDPVCGVDLFDSACADVVNNDQNRSIIGPDSEITSRVTSAVPSGVLVPLGGAVHTVEKNVRVT
jgi:hypothetical protein